VKSISLKSLKIQRLKNSFVSSGSWFLTRISKRKDFMKPVKNSNPNSINQVKIHSMEKITKVVKFQLTVSQCILKTLGTSSEAKRNWIYRTKEKWLHSIDVAKSKLKPFKRLKLRCKNSRKFQALVQFLTFKIHAHQS
jgi:hypothetical protein